ncbi:hypothetical protein JTE90_011436 [Oedothorax gibbosus]|uniref:Glycolipid transfer protein domain-containing protein n=1 Tax=Oedothorax gibbosus TaxID=931172 RepID=A0AAV6VDS8_9ARAC|nr:hypothetical protein JTE90_011436 [Oedothorax gibbosus]
MATVKESNNLTEEALDKFDINLLHDSLAKCCTDNDSLDMEQYLIAFRELYRFFSLLGSVFGFVASDILSKVGILDDYLRSSSHYSTVQSMVEHEVSTSTTAVATRPSGARTLLRLHRSLEFISSFMEEFGTAESAAKSSTIAQKCYKDTLARYHPWLVQKGAGIAMYTLPSKKHFIEKVKGEPCDDQQVEYYGKMMADIAQASRRVYDVTQKLYEANDLLDLP